MEYGKIINSVELNQIQGRTRKILASGTFVSLGIPLLKYRFRNYLYCVW